VDPDTEVREATEKAIAEFQRGLEALPPHLRNAVTPEQWDWEIQFLTLALKHEIPDLVLERRGKLKDEFTANCTMASEALVKEARKRLTSRTVWTLAANAEWTDRFSDAVHYSLVPPAMRQVVDETYNYWRRFTIGRLQDDIEHWQNPCDIGVHFVLAFIFCAVVLALAPLINQCQGRNAA
jgi:hypothetical protein